MATVIQGNPLLSDERVAKVRGELDQSSSTMTVGGTITATLALLVVFLAAGGAGWSAASGSVTEFTNPATGEVTYSGSWPAWIFVAMLVGVVAGFATALVPKIAPITGFIYALGYGAAVGAISSFYELQFDGIVGQAVLATVGVFLAVLVAYATGIIKVTGKFVMTILLAMAGIFVMYLVGWIATLFGADIMFWNDPTPLGIGISIVIAIVAALSLAIDFEFINRGTEAGLPKRMEWYGAFALLSGLVWLYLTLLRLLALLRQN